MKNLEAVKFNINKFAKELCELIKGVPPYYTQRINEASKICELQNQVAVLSNSTVAYVLMDTIKRIAYAKIEPNYETICMYLESAINDLASGMDAVDMLHKYDMILYELGNSRPEHYRGNRAKIFIVDDHAPMFKEYFEKYYKENPMKISDMIKNLQEFMNENGDLECWYAVDDEGNAYHKMYYPPSLYYVNEDGEVRQIEDIEYYEEDVEDYKPICIVN